MTRTRKARLLLAALGVGVGLAAWVAWLVLPIRDQSPVRLLLPLSQRIVERADTLSFPIHWLDDDTLQVVRFAKGKNGEYPAGFHLFRGDLRRRVEEHVQTLGDFSSTELTSYRRRGTLAPDGKHRLLFGYDETSPTLSVYDVGRTRSVRGKVTLPADERPGDIISFAWHPDSKRWSIVKKERGSWKQWTYVLGNQKPLEVHDVSFALPEPHQSLELLGFTGSDDPVFLCIKGTGVTNETQTDIRVVSPVTHKVLLTVPSPPNRPNKIRVDAGGWRVSPDGSKIAWVVERKLISAAAARDTYGAELWMSRLDGRDVRLVGVVPDGIRIVEWSPCSRYIAFRHESDIYRVPASVGRQAPSPAVRK